MRQDEAIEILEEVRTLDDSMYAYNKAYCEALGLAIDALKAERKTVRWINPKTTMLQGANLTGYDCPECGKRAIHRIDIIDSALIKINYDFCPSCGVKIEEME